jgi:predicted nucleic acid-binding protein
MRYVLDANVGLKMGLPEADSAKAIRLQEDFRNGTHELLAPDFFPVELGHALTRAERRHIIRVGQATALFDNIVDPCPELHASMPLVTRAIELSSQTRASVFDCLYLLLAEEQDCPFVTSDRKILNSFPNEPRIIELSSL